jgi:hypothetical protein
MAGASSRQEVGAVETNIEPATGLFHCRSTLARYVWLLSFSVILPFTHLLTLLSFEFAAQ